MSVWGRWQLAFPLICLSLMMISAGLVGTITWWFDYGVLYRGLSVVICLILGGSLAVSVSIGVKPARDVPWARIGLVFLGFLVACGVTALRRLL